MPKCRPARWSLRALRHRIAPAAIATLALWIAGAVTPACTWSPTSGGRDGGSSREPLARLLVLPEDDGRALVDGLAGAKRRAWVEMYLLTDDGAIGALAATHARGADVRVLLEPSPFGAETANQGAFAALAQAGVDVRWFAVPGGLVHAKVLLVDDGVWISTANLTSAGLDRNRELAVLDADPGDVEWVAALWQGDAIGSPPTSAPARAAGAPVPRVLASPIDARARLTAAVDAARTSIALEVEELSDPDFVARLIAAYERGVAVSVVVPAAADRSAATSAAAARLGTAGVDARATGGPTLHAKAMTVDDHITYVGSVNFTRASFDDNREVGLLLDDPATAARVRDAISRDAAKGVPL